MESEELSWVDKRKEVESFRMDESWEEKMQDPIPTYEEFLILLWCTQDQIDQCWFTQGVRDIYKVYGRMADVERCIAELNDAKTQNLGPEFVESVSKRHVRYLENLRWLVEIEEEELNKDIFSHIIDVRNISVEDSLRISKIDRNRSDLWLMLKLHYNTKMLALEKKVTEYLEIPKSL